MLRKTLSLILLLASGAVAARVGFVPPDEPSRVVALGDVSGEPPELRRALDLRGFEPIPPPESGDWLSAHEEPGQTYAQLKASKRNFPSGKRRKLYLLPLGEVAAGKSPSLEGLRELTAAYFGLETVLLPRARLDPGAFSPRENPGTGIPQILTGDVMTWLKGRLPEDAYFLLAITLSDLYPDPAWNFVFGQGSPRGRVGVYSFARLDPAFPAAERQEKLGEEERARLFLRRAFRTLVHEAGHMFGLLHCIYFRCVMNGSNNLEEADSQPTEPCPICLRKLHSSCRFDPAARLEKLARALERLKLEPEAAWASRRAQWIRGKLSKP